MYKTVLLVGAELHSSGLDISTRGRDVSVIFGDGAGAAIVEATDDPKRGVLAIELHADGRHGNKLWVEAPASRYQPRLTAEMMAEGKHFPRMDGPFVFKHAIVKMPEVVGSVLGKAGVKAEDVKLFIPHQANLRISEVVQKALGLRTTGLQQHPALRQHHRSIPIALTEARRAAGETGRSSRSARSAPASPGGGLMRW
jgi:3-oxoacyl-[acyl-carrier-protein] synthase-3